MLQIVVLNNTTRSTPRLIVLKNPLSSIEEVGVSALVDHFYRVGTIGGADKGKAVEFI